MPIGKRGVVAVVAAIVLLLLFSRLWTLIRFAIYCLAMLIGSFHAIDQRVIQQSGCETIPQVNEIEILLGKGDHAVSGGSYDAFPNGGNDFFQWSTEVYFAGRYQLTMYVDIVVDRKSSKVLRVIGAPKFMLLEITRVGMLDGLPRDISYDGSAQREFSDTDWKKVFDANGDFSAIGIHLRNDSPIPNFDELVKWSQLHSRQRYGVQ